jgi:uncharacterized protein (DUF983 family)
VTENGRARRPSRLAAILLQRCPRCLRGRVFRGLLDMRETCPVCGLRFGREEGYFAGAMYVSYLIAIALVFGIFGVLWLTSSRTELAMYVLLGVTAVLYVPLVPIVYRYSRVVWMHFDRSFGPADPEEPAARSSPAPRGPGTPANGR